MNEEELKIKLDRWFTENWDHFVNEVRTNISYGQMEKYHMDLCVQVFEDFMNKSFSKKLQMYQDDKILNFLLYAASFQIRSGTSPFYNTYRKSRMNNAPEYYIPQDTEYTLDDVSIDDYFVCVQEALKEDNIGWYYTKLLELKFLKQMTYDTIKEEYGICVSTLKKDVTRALQAVEQHCKHLNE